MWKWIAAIGLALVLGLAVGRFTVPTKIVERDHIVTEDRDTELTWHAYVGHTEVKTKIKTNWKTVTQWAKDGSVTQTVVATKERDSDSKTDVSDNSGQVKETIKYQDVEHIKTVEAKAPDWILGAGVGLTANRDVLYTGEVARRIAGPVFVAIQGQKPWAATVGVKLLF